MTLFFLLVFGVIDNTIRYPYLIECPFEGTAPVSVSLVANPCDNAENNLKILNARPVDGVKKRFGVCSKQVSLKNRNYTMRFVEWVHMVRLLGAEKVHFSYRYIHPEVFEVVRYFENQGMLETWEWFDPSNIHDTTDRSWQTRQLQVNLLVDCFYRVKNLYDYVVIIDYDELIMPVMKEDMTWEDIIKRMNCSEHRDAYISQNVYYPEIEADPIEEVPKYLYMLQHVQRSQNFSNYGLAVKSILNTERVLSVHNHMPHQCISEKYQCKLHDIPTNISQCSHYRDHLNDNSTFHITIEDKTIWKYKDQLLIDVKQTLEKVKFVP